MYPVSISKPSLPQDVPRSQDLGEVGNSSVKVGTVVSGQTPHKYLTSHSEFLDIFDHGLTALWEMENPSTEIIQLFLQKYSSSKIWHIF